MATKVAINGFGRIGRLVLRAGLKNADLEFVAVNDLVPAETLAHLFKYDSTFGEYPGTVEAQGSNLIIDGKTVVVTAERNPADLPWTKLGVDTVIESTGFFRSKEKAGLHIKAGAKKVIISAPGQDEDITICMGINEDKYDPELHNIISNASCTTNCMAPLVKLLNDELGISHGIMTTIHSYTNDQALLDVAHEDLRRARAAAVSMIPSSTGAAKAIGLVVPELKGKLSGCAVRVPTPDVSLVDFAAVVKKSTTKEEVNAMFKKAASEGPMAKVLDYTEIELVSKDFTGNPASSTFDATMTDVMEGTLVKVFAWYDNEWGYSNRVVDLAAYIAAKVPVKA